MKSQAFKALAIAFALLVSGIAADAVAAQAPMIVTLSPNAGKSAGGDTVIITGIVGFTGTVPATGVTFNGVAATGVVVNSDTQITCVTPAHAGGGAVNVQIVAPGGADTLANGFTYVNPPTFTSVSPNNGPAGGGNTVSIIGTGFLSTTGAAGVTFASGPTVPATSYSVVSDTQIIAVVPAHGSGPAVTITINAPGGAVTSGAVYTYAVAAIPTITSLTPSSGTIAGGTTVIIAGTNFNNGNVSGITFGGVAVGAGNFTIIDGQTLSVITPAHPAAGPVPVIVTNTAGASAAFNSYMYTSANTNLQVNIKVTIAARADIQWGNATSIDDGTPPIDHTAAGHHIDPYTWVVKDAEFGGANQINLGTSYPTNDPNFPHAITISNVSLTNAKISIDARCTGAESAASGIAWTAGAAANTDIFSMTATLGSAGVQTISPGPVTLNSTVANYIVKGIDQSLVLTFNAPTAISNPLTAGVQQTVTVTLTATAH